MYATNKPHSVTGSSQTFPPGNDAQVGAIHNYKFLVPFNLGLVPSDDSVKARLETTRTNPEYSRWRAPERSRSDVRIERFRRARGHQRLA